MYTHKLEIHDMNIHDIANNAACLWESVLELDMFPDIHQTMGTAYLRETVCEFAVLVEESYETAFVNGYDDAFDWEFVPWFLENCIDPEHLTPVPGWHLLTPGETLDQE